MLSPKARFARRDPVFALRALAAATAALLLLAVAGCGDDPDPGEPGGLNGTAFTVTLDPDGEDGDEEPLVEDVSCADGERQRICQAAADITPADLEPADSAQACTEIFGGPDTAAIMGTLDGEPIDVTLTRANGCEIERFERALPLLTALFPDYKPGASLRG